MKKSDPFLKQYIDTKRCSIKNIISPHSYNYFNYQVIVRLKFIELMLLMMIMYLLLMYSYSIIIMKMNMVEDI